MHQSLQFLYMYLMKPQWVYSWVDKNSVIYCKLVILGNNIICICTLKTYAQSWITRVSIEGPSNPLRAGGSYTLTCNATADITPVVRWTDPSGNSVETGEGISVTGPLVSGDTTILQLTFDYLRTSQAGTYSCLSIVDTPTSVQRDVRDIIVQSELIYM